MLERSDLIVQIVDGRNPLLFYCKDLVKVISELNSSKKHLVVVNKADFLSDYMRSSWAQFFQSNNIYFAFFSAKEEAARQELENKEPIDISDDELQSGQCDIVSSDEEYEQSSDICADNQYNSGRQSDAGCDAIVSIVDHCAGPLGAMVVSAPLSPVSVLNTKQLMERFLQMYWGVEEIPADSRSITVGLVGYPNVGKSSIINVMG